MRNHRAAVAALLLPLLAACGSSTTSTPAKAGGSHNVASPAPTGSARPAATGQSAALTASTVTAKLAAAVPGLRTILTYTAASDPNHLLGRPGEYTSKTAFGDPRVKPADVAGQRRDAIARGGSVEVYPTAAGAKARAAYIQRMVQAMPSAAEYDYVHGGVLVRVSGLLTPAQAAVYKAAVATL
jgi:hypothetical protein